ncbi:DnaJ-domain-containing protein [Trametes sanguinea]|nr:DnaJ-domain-containing protein [Trametes sanguinea]
MSTTTFTSTTNFYEVLGVKKDATQEEVRKAYRRRALQTHPDRLPQDVSQADKKKAEEQFRLVNNAYEVLNNEESRKLYDKHGVWPPPTEQPEYRRQSSRDAFDSFNDPFFASPFGSRSRRGYTFTDPFELFNSLFGDLHSAFESDPFFSGSPFFRSPFHDPFFRSPFDDPFFRSPFGGSPFGGSMLGGSPFGGFLGGPMFPQIEGGNTRRYTSRTEAVGRNGQWVSRSQMTRTVNGRTETITKMIDADGNEHVTYSTPDGGERYTINGIEQPSHSNRPIEGPRRSGTAPSSRQPPQPIADAPAQPASYFAPPQQSQSFSIPITSGPHQAHSPPANAHFERTQSHRSRRSSQRERPSMEDAPRRSHTSRKSSASSLRRTDSRGGGAGHTRTDSASASVSPPRSLSRDHTSPPKANPAERMYGGHDPVAAAAAAAATNGYVPTSYARDPRRDSAQSGHSHQSHHDSKRRSSRHNSRDYRDRERERVAAEQAQAAPGGHGHAQRGWRGW